MEYYFQQGLAPSSKRVYKSAKDRFISFCEKFHFNPLPVTETLLCQYVSYLATQNIMHSSIKVYLSAIRHLHIENHMPDPHISNMARLEQVVKGVKRDQAHKLPNQRTRLPITADLMRQMKSILVKNPKDEDNIMIWAAMCLCFFGFLRAGEMTLESETSFDPGAHLCFADVAIDDPANPAILKVRIKASKTDPFRKGVDIYLGRTNKDLCPLEAILPYLAMRGDQQGFLFQFKDGRLLTKDRFVSKVRELLHQSGVDPKKYAGHSFRIGAATTASRHGVSEATIKMLGRWESSAYLRYIKTPRGQLASISSKLSS